MNIVLYEPEIPQNTGNIGRTCVASGTKLHLIKPLGFSIDEKAVRRAGMDYWKDLELYVYESYSDFLARNPGAELYFATTKAVNIYTQARYSENSYVMFGPESRGIPEEILAEHKDTCIRIPMLSEYRSLNLSNAAAIVLYEALRQSGFEGMRMQGELHRCEWND